MGVYLWTGKNRTKQKNEKTAINTSVEKQKIRTTAISEDLLKTGKADTGAKEDKAVKEDKKSGTDTKANNALKKKAEKIDVIVPKGKMQLKTEMKNAMAEIQRLHKTLEKEDKSKLTSARLGKVKERRMPISPTLILRSAQRRRWNVRITQKR